MAKSFTAQVEGFAKKTVKLQEAILKESTQRLMERMQTPRGKGGNLPVDTGFLRASFHASLNAPVSDVKFKVGGAAFGGGDDYAFVIAGASIEDTIYGMYTANYAGFVHYGEGGVQWVTLAAMQWNAIVNVVAKEFSR